MPRKERHNRRAHHQHADQLAGRGKILDIAHPLERHEGDKDAQQKESELTHALHPAVIGDARSSHTPRDRAPISHPPRMKAAGRGHGRIHRRAGPGKRRDDVFHVPPDLQQDIRQRRIGVEKGIERGKVESRRRRTCLRLLLPGRAVGQGLNRGHVGREARVVRMPRQRWIRLRQSHSPMLISEVHVAVDVARPGIHNVSAVVDASARVVEYVAGDRELFKSPRVDSLGFRGRRN